MQATTTMRNITHKHCERWLSERAPTPAAMSMNRNLS